MHPLTWLRRWPLLIAMGLLVLPGAVAAGNALVGWAWPGTVLWARPRLQGAHVVADWPAVTAAGLWHGTYQRDAALRFGLSMPLLPEAVGVKSQLYVSALHQSPIPAVTIGTRRRLYETAYVDEYCHRSVARQAARAQQWAGELAAMQRWYAARGRLFLYVLTPSKAAVEPQNLPADFDCPALPADREGVLPAWIDILRRHGVGYVDTATLVARAKPDYPVDLFPRGGTHWTEAAATLATQALVQQVNRAGLPWRLTPFTFTWRVAPPGLVDRDLTDLLNLPWPSLDYPATAVSIAAAPPASCQPVNIGVVGGSFVYEVAWALMKLPCPPHIEFYYYFQLEHAHFPGDIRRPVLAEQRDAELLDRAEIVLLEENEQLATASQHGPAFYRLVAGAAGLE